MKTLRKTPLAVFVGGLAVAVAVSLITARSSNGEQPAKKRAAPAPQAQAYAQSRVDVAEAAMPVVVFAPLYGSSPRIIHVPQSDQDTLASANGGDEAVGAIDGDVNARPVRRIRPAPRN